MWAASPVCPLLGGGMTGGGKAVKHETLFATRATICASPAAHRASRQPHLPTRVILGEMKGLPRLVAALGGVCFSAALYSPVVPPYSSIFICFSKLLTWFSSSQRRDCSSLPCTSFLQEGGQGPLEDPGCSGLFLSQLARNILLLRCPLNSRVVLSFELAVSRSLDLRKVKHFLPLPEQTQWFFLLLKVRRQPGAFLPLLVCAAPRAQTMASIVTWRIMALLWIMYLFPWSKDELDTILQKSMAIHYSMVYGFHPWKHRESMSIYFLSL